MLVTCVSSSRFTQRAGKLMDATCSGLVAKVFWLAT